MTTNPEKRRTIRRTIDVPIRCSYFNMPDTAGARIVNFSQDGMYFVSDMEFHLRSAVFICVKNNNRLHQKLPENTVGLRQTTLAEVRWCRKISENPMYFQVGVKYYEPWY